MKNKMLMYCVKGMLMLAMGAVEAIMVKRELEDLVNQKFEEAVNHSDEET